MGGFTGIRPFLTYSSALLIVSGLNRPGRLVRIENSRYISLERSYRYGFFEGIKEEELIMPGISPVRSFILTIVAIIISSFVALANQPPAETEIQELTGRVDSLFSQWDRSDSPGCAVAIVKDGTPVYKKGFGCANLEYGIPITPTTVFPAASVSKQFTAFSIAMLAHHGKLSLDDDIRLYLPELPDFGKSITIRQMIHHMSGLRDQWVLLGMAGVSPADVITTENILSLVRHQKELNFDPGAEISYCNTGYTLLAEIVARVAGETYSEYTREDIFEPLDMKNSHFHDDVQMIVRNRAYPYLEDENELIKGVLNYANVGATGLFTTAEDMAKWLINFDKAGAGGPDVIRQMYETGILNGGEATPIGFGVGVWEYRGQRIVTHSGQDAGYRSYTAYFPEQRFGIVILTNFYSIDPSSLSMQIANIFLESVLTGEEADEPSDEKTEAEAIPEVPKLDKDQLREYCGRFYSDEIETTYHIVIRDGALVATHIRNEDVNLTSLSKDEFSGDQWWFHKIHFDRNEDGDIIGFRLSAGGVRNLRFEKM
jgi:CubicO group peptidase (beta-lactamase class C family)